MTALARHYAVTTSQVRRSFASEFGLSVRDYQRIVRLVAALGEVRGGKIDVIALQVGYNSKKNFYHAFRQVTGLTPSEFRKLPDDVAHQIRSAAQARLVSKRSMEKIARTSAH